MLASAKASFAPFAFMQPICRCVLTRVLSLTLTFACVLDSVASVGWGAALVARAVFCVFAMLEFKSDRLHK
jgi:uncharacterized membrane protein